MAVKSCQNCGKAPTRANPLKNCSRCHDATYCSGECQHKDWPKHKNNCANILAVHLFPAGNEALMKEENTQKVFIDQNHPVFTAGTVAPVSQLIGIPLLLYRIGRLDEYRENNRPVTYLMINGDNGFADLSWQDNVGKVLVVRKDRKPLKPQTLKLIWKFCHLSACGYHFFNKVDVQDRYNPNLFRRWCELYLYDEYTNREQTEWQELFLKFETDPEDPF